MKKKPLDETSKIKYSKYAEPQTLNHVTHQEGLGQVAVKLKEQFGKTLKYQNVFKSKLRAWPHF